MWTMLRPDAVKVLKDKFARKSLARYFEVMQDSKPAKFTIAQKIAANFSKEDSLSTLWKAHDKLLKTFKELESEIDNRLLNLNDLEAASLSFLDLKIEIANRILQNCHFCTRRCGVNRIGGSTGYCKCGTQITVSSMFEHMGEEPELVPSGTIFTLGCTLRCLHCQNWTISQWIESGEINSPKHLAKSVEYLRQKGCRNANLVGGDPTPWLAQWLETFKMVDTNIPIVWNSNSYYTEETAKLLSGFADVYLLDFKYGNNKCAERISDAPDYWEACTRNHIYGNEYGELLVRLLILPSHLNCCTEKIVDWISKNLGVMTRTNVMFQFRPEWRAYEIPELRRRLTQAEKEKAVQIAKKSGLINFIT